MPPLMVIMRSPVLSFCLSMSMCAPVNSRIALILQPPLPITLDITVDGTDTFFDRLTTSFHPSSLFGPRLGLATVNFPFGEERGDGPDFVQVDRELLVPSLTVSDNFIEALPETDFLSSFGNVTRTDGCFLLATVAVATAGE